MGNEVSSRFRSSWPAFRRLNSIPGEGPAGGLCAVLVPRIGSGGSMGQGHTSLPPLRGASAPTPAGVWAVSLGCKAELPEPPVLGSGVLISLVLSNLNWIKNNSVWVGEGSVALLHFCFFSCLGCSSGVSLVLVGSPQSRSCSPRCCCPFLLGRTCLWIPHSSSCCHLFSSPNTLSFQEGKSSFPDTWEQVGAC